MKKLITGLIVVAMVLTSPAAFAASTQTVPIQVDVPQILDLSVSVYSIPSSVSPDTMNPFTDGTKITPAAMNFGTLVPDTDGWGVWRSNIFFTVILAATTSGRPYKITQTCAGIISGSNHLNKNIVMTPDYQQNDSLTTDHPELHPQGPPPDGATTGPAGLAVGANKLIYDSGSGGKTRLARCYYGLATGKKVLDPTDPPGTAIDPPGAEPLGYDAPSGSYGGSVVFSVVLK